MRIGSLFTGIGGFDLAASRCGFDVAFQCEIDPKCRGVLARHFQGVPCFEDVSIINASDLSPIDVLVGGFPCQDLSLAGRRAGLAGERSGLFYQFARLIEATQAPWVVIENVRGLLSSNQGRDMGAVLGTLAQLGYGYAYRMLDAQYYGLAQRRKRVFIVAHHTRWTDPAKVLFESQSLCWDSAPSREAAQDVAGTLGASPNGGGWASDTDRMTLLPFVKDERNITSAANRTRVEPGLPSPTLHGGLGMSVGYRMLRFDHYLGDNTASTLKARDFKDSTDLVVSRSPTTFNWQSGGQVRIDPLTDRSPALQASQTPAELLDHDYQWQIRRFLPVECERLQGFPDDWTAYDETGKEVSDSVRYRMLGNAVAVPVVEWLFRHIKEIEMNQDDGVV